MAKPDPSRLKLENYPIAVEVETRFQDLDPLGHINNVAMAGLFEAGRIKFNHANGTANFPRPSGDRWLIAAVNINYLAESYFPEPVTIGHGVSRIGSSSWEIASAAFQNGVCVATCDATLVYTNEEGAQALVPDFIACLEAVKIAG